MSNELAGKVPVHPTEDLLEEYGFGRVCDPTLTVLEEHLFVCDTCQTKLEELEEYAVLMKTALAEFEEDREANPPHPRHRFALPWLVDPWFVYSGIPGTILAGVLILALVTATIAWRTKPIPETATVQLTAFRGGESRGLALAPSGRPLNLTVDAANLPPAPGFRLELVSQSGRKIWTGEAKITGTTLSAHITDGPGSGVYWVRLYRSQGDLLREYGVRLQ